jgi:hypothetical protein
MGDRSRRCCQIFYWAIWIRSWNGGGTGSAAMPMTATCTCGRGRLGVSDDIGNGIPDQSATLEGKRGEERGGSPVGAKVSGLHNDAAQAVTAEGRPVIARTNEGESANWSIGKDEVGDG